MFLSMRPILALFPCPPWAC